MSPEPVAVRLHLLLLAALGAGCNLSKGPCPGGTSTPIGLEGGGTSGYERCEDGTIHRAAKATFDPTIPLPACGGDEEVRSCESDADCTDGPNGMCGSYQGTDWKTYTPTTNCGCFYACASDADCGAGEACVPPEADGVADYPRCRPASCTVDTDCTSGECGLSVFNDGCSWDVNLTCRDRSADECRTDEDCADADGASHCAAYDFSDSAGWSCESAGCAIGRPLLVDGVARVAPRAAPRPGGPTRGAAWAEPVAPSARPVGAVAARLAAHWAEVAALEHASVGSFARFTLQLLAVGAPPDLVADAQLAAADEVRHAQLAYGLASAYAGSPVAPGPLDLAGAAPALDVRAVLDALIDEACVGETLGAAEAAHASAGCTDAAVRAVLDGIAADEARHAALAWRTVRWILADRAPELRDHAAARFEAALAAALVAPLTGPAEPDHGVLGPAARRALHAAVVARVLRPMVEEVVGEGAPFRTAHPPGAEVA